MQGARCGAEDGMEGVNGGTHAGGDEEGKLLDDGCMTVMCSYRPVHGASRRLQP
jgi:hypothetical protein